jgi:CheY-like chemotaxis protein
MQVVLNPILLVDDSDNDVELMLIALEKLNIANPIVICHDGQEALDYLFNAENAAKPLPLFIMLDIKMPKVDGLEVLAKIKEAEHLKRIPVVMLTSSREHRDLISSYELNVNAYVVKPVDFKQFTETVSSLGYFWAIVNESPANHN